MIDRSALLSFNEIFSRCNLKPLRRGRGECPFCGSRTGFSASNDLGVFHCFSCQTRGDKIDFIRNFYACSFRDALGFFNIDDTRRFTRAASEDGRQRAIERVIEEGLEWAARIGKSLRNELFNLQLIGKYAEERLNQDADNALGWSLLEIVYKGLGTLENVLDSIDVASKEQRLEAYVQVRSDPELAECFNDETDANSN